MATATFSRSLVAARPGHEARRQVRRITGSGVDARPARARDLGHLARALQTVARDRGQQVDALLAPLDIIHIRAGRGTQRCRDLALARRCGIGQDIPPPDSVRI